MIIEFALAFLTAPPAIALPEPVMDLTPVEYVLPVRRVVSYPPEPNLRMLSQFVLSPEAETAFYGEFSAGGYFGAFATSKDGGWGYSVGSNSLGAARDIAMRQCENANTTRCAVVAEIVPTGYQPPAPGEVAMAYAGLRYYQDATTNTAFHAMAIAEDGAYSKVWGVATQADANAQVLADCETRRMTNIPGLTDMPCFLLPPTK